MTRKRTIGTRAALGGLTAVAVLIAATPAAKADEASDLKANQEVLQRRIDQLAQQNVGAGSYLEPTQGGPVSVQMTGGSFPRSFLIPGTDTSIRIGGEVRANFLYWFNGGAPNGIHQTNAGATGQAAQIPLNNTNESRRGHNVSTISPQQSKLSFETRTPTAWGEARTFIEFDFASNPVATNRAYAISDNIFDRMPTPTGRWVRCSGVRRTRISAIPMRASR